MRTKALLGLTALAVSALTAMAADNVYSLNIVGYVNKTVNPGYNLLVNPLKAGVTNGANEIMPVILDEKILTWTGTGYSVAVFDGFTETWQDAAGNPTGVPQLPPGKGFFYYNPGVATNFTFVGEVIPAPGTTNDLPLPAGYSMIGSPLPAGQTNVTSAPVSLPLILDMKVLKWTGTAYVVKVYDGFTLDWIDAAGNPTTAPDYAVGEGFLFYNPGTSNYWRQSLP